MADEREEGEALTRQLSIEAAITRARLASDVEALGEKLAPRNLKSEAKQAVTHVVRRQAWRLRRVVASGTLAMVRGARRHPVPVALALIGFAALVWRAQRA